MELVPIVFSLSESFCPTLQHTHIQSHFPQKRQLPFNSNVHSASGVLITIFQFHRKVTASSNLSIKTQTTLHPLLTPTHSTSDPSCPGISRALLGVANHLPLCFISEGELASSEEQHKAAHRVDKDPHRKLVFADYICEACWAG